mgnify:FL=1|tara:strand:+ start:1576 stop:1962 length:387 start_codon:yes stop_codon:yes gene_type:complete
MTIKVVKLKSGEDIIADIQEVQDKDTGVRRAFVFTHAYKIAIEKEMVPETEERNQIYQGRILLERWQPLTYDEEIAVTPDWVVSIVEPILSVLEAYGQTMKPQEEGKATFGTDLSVEPNVSITDEINN